jgi:hypothetical protein
VGWRQCEVVVTLPGGRRYSAIVEARSTFHAALVFQAHCLNAPEGLQRPHIEPGTVLEVRPIYKVKVQEAMLWADRKDSRDGRKGRQQR